MKTSATTLEFFYYTVYPIEGTRDYSLVNRHKFYTYLSRVMNFTVRKKQLKQIFINKKILKEKGNMDVEITIDAVHHMKYYDLAVIFSGDSDFLALADYLMKNNKKVMVYSSKNNISKELKKKANHYADILEIKEDIWDKNLIHRKK